MSEHLRDLAADVSKLLAGVEARAGAFAARSGVACRSGCGECCRNPDIECTVLELLPAAFALVDEGRGSELQTLLSESPPQDGCLFLARTGQASDGRQLGRCTRYALRPSVCMLFGASVRVDGHGRRQAVTCRIMKDDDPVRVAAVDSFVQDSPLDEIPLTSEASLALVGLNPSLGTQRLPIREALRMALEKVLLSTSYSTEANA